MSEADIEVLFGTVLRIDDAIYATQKTALQRATVVSAE